MTSTPPRQRSSWQPPGQQEPAADEVSRPFDGVHGISRRLVAIAGAALLTVVVVVVFSSLL